MKILNAMFSRGSGGIENASLRYSDALAFLGHEQLNVIDERSPLAASFSMQPTHTIRQLNEWDLRAIWKLHNTIDQFQPDIILSHGNRANRLLGRANWWSSVPQVAICHRFQFNKLNRYDAVFCVSRGVQELAIKNGLPAKTTRFMPNMITPPDQISPLPAGMRTPPTIGFLGRFVREKGADILLEALALLQERQIPFRAIFAGDGPQRNSLLKKAKTYGLHDHVTFSGWIDDLPTFFEQIDVLVIPSRHESFGLIVLESWQQNRPIIATRTTGPSELIDDAKTGILCDIDANAIAEAFTKLHSSPSTVETLCRGGQERVHDYYVEQLAPRLDMLLKDVLKRTK